MTYDIEISGFPGPPGPDTSDMLAALAATGGADLVGAADGGTVQDRLFPLVTLLGFDYQRAPGRIWIGDSNTHPSFNATLAVARNLNLATLSENAHDFVVAPAIANMGGFAYSGIDNGGTVAAGNGNHIVGMAQARWSWNSPGTLDDYYGGFDVLTVTDGEVLRATGMMLKAPVLSGDGIVHQYRGVAVEDMDESSDGSNDTDKINYAFQHPGKARIDHNGHARFYELRIGDNDGVTIEQITQEIDGSRNALIYQGQSGVWNWRTGMVKDETDYVWKGNNITAWRIKGVTNHLHPGADGTQNIGHASFRILDGFSVNAWTVSCDETKKHFPAFELTEAHLRAARRIKAEIGPFQWLDSIAEKGGGDREKGMALARIHWGPKAQAVWRILIEEGLEQAPAKDQPLTSARLGFLTYDRWDDVTEPVMKLVEVKRTRKVRCASKILDPRTGRPKLVETTKTSKFKELRATGERRVVRAAGELYGLRLEGLFGFLWRCEGAENEALRDRLAAIEAHLGLAR